MCQRPCAGQRGCPGLRALQALALWAAARGGRRCYGFWETEALGGDTTMGCLTVAPLPL